MAASATTKACKQQKIIMLQKQKKPTAHAHGQTAPWLTSNPAADKVQSKQPAQISTTKFIDSQQKMHYNSTMNTARVNKKHLL